MKLYDVPDGQVYVDSVDINQVNCFSVREQVTKISQEVFLFLINEEAPACYSGQKGVDDVAGIIQNCVQLYVNENR